MSARGHSHYGAPGSTQNQGNSVGDRPCVRQSKIGREHEGGNQMKALMGNDDLKWNVNKTEGAYQGGRVHDTNGTVQAPKAQYESAPTGNVPRRGTANQQSYNLFTGADEVTVARNGTSHTHNGGVGSTQNQGNSVGDRPCVRQSKIGREHEGGNQMKDIMGNDDLKWNVNKTEGAYKGGRVYDAEIHALADLPANPIKTDAKQEPAVRRRGGANQQTCNLFGGN